MPEVAVRKKLTSVEEIFHEGGPRSDTPLRRAVALVVRDREHRGEEAHIRNGTAISPDDERLELVEP